MLDKKILFHKLGKLVRNPRSFVAENLTSRNVFDRMSARTFLFFSAPDPTVVFHKPFKIKELCH